MIAAKDTPWMCALPRIARRLSAAALMAALGHASALAEPVVTPGDEPPLPAAWVADPKTKCKVWNPHPQRGETISWNGACKNGFAEGRGYVQWFRDGAPYERSDGQWSAGKQFGDGTQVWPGGRYDGGMKDGEAEGRGVLVLNDVRYQGQFHDGLPEGEGVLKGPDGVFQGMWKKGCFDDGFRRASLGVPVKSCPMSGKGDAKGDGKGDPQAAPKNAPKREPKGDPAARPR